MIKTEITKSNLFLNFEGWDALWSFKGSLNIELEKISNIRRVSKEDSVPCLKVTGTYLPRVVSAGIYYDLAKGSKEFWCTRHSGGAVVIELKDFEYSRLVFDLDENVDEFISKIRKSLPVFKKTKLERILT